jgi:hypothetical protein
MNVVLDDSIRLPIGFASLAAFRRWTKSRAYPGRGNFAYLGGDLWVDLTMETLLHNQLQHLFEVVLGGLVMNEQLGMYFGDRMRLVNVEAVLSSEPDGMFASQKSIHSGRVRWEQGPESLEVIGAPDMVLRSSAHIRSKRIPSCSASYTRRLASPNTGSSIRSGAMCRWRSCG